MTLFTSVRRIGNVQPELHLEVLEMIVQIALLRYSAVDELQRLPVYVEHVEVVLVEHPGKRARIEQRRDPISSGVVARVLRETEVL